MTTEPQKDETKCDDDSEGYEDEALVHGTDMREPIYDTNLRETDIVQCIGELTVEFSYPANGNYRRKELGTGTVITVLGNTGIILTCAHIMRAFVVECSQCHAYYNISKKDINKDQWMRCRNKKCDGWQISTRSDWKMIKQTDIKFRRRSIKYGAEFGKMEGNPYHCNVKVIDDKNYQKYPGTNAGYDIAILSFADSTDYYAKYCRNIILEKFGQFISTNEFHLFGYPGKQRKMYGGSSSARRQWEFKNNAKTQKYFFKHKEIDSSQGQSGSALFYRSSGKFVIFAVHCGGHPRLGHNIGNLIDGDNFFNFNWEKKCFVNQVITKMDETQYFEQQLSAYNSNSNKKERPISISVRTGTKTRKLQRKFTKNDQIVSIKQAFVDEINNDKSVDRLVLIKSNKTLQSEKTLLSYGITKSCTVTLKFKVIGGMGQVCA